jgi:Crinkler effector protein N-terminal domain
VVLSGDGLCATNTMADDLNLFLFILGDSPASEHTFSITVTTSNSVSELKKRVHLEAHSRFSAGVGAIDLILWKVLPLRSLLYCAENLVIIS